MNPNNPTILLTFDVEDWFQVENLKQCIPFSSWPNCELRIEKNIHRILDLLDSINSNNSSNSINPSNPKATFFILGWIAERLPSLVQEIRARGHEVASHGYYHELCHKQSIEAFRFDLASSKKLLEDIIGSPIFGYRAPSFSVTSEDLRHIEAAGYLYDSSFNDFRFNKRYGHILLNGNGKKGILHQIAKGFYEIQISNLKIGNGVIPWGGGGYFRLIPSRIFQQGVLSILNRQGAYLFYMHPWEIDPDQPKLSDIPISFKFRHYVNLDKTYSKLVYFLNSFSTYRFLTCSQYITQQTQATQSTQ